MLLYIGWSTHAPVSFHLKYFEIIHQRRNIIKNLRQPRMCTILYFNLQFIETNIEVWWTLNPAAHTRGGTHDAQVWFYKLTSNLLILYLLNGNLSRRNKGWTLYWLSILTITFKYILLWILTKSSRENLNNIKCELFSHSFNALTVMYLNNNSLVSILLISLFTWLSQSVNRIIVLLNNMSKINMILR